jgi:hypothetical protein
MRRFGRVGYGALGAKAAATVARASACGRCAGNDSLILVFSSSIRQAIFTNAPRMAGEPRRNLSGRESETIRD